MQADSKPRGEDDLFWTEPKAEDSPQLNGGKLPKRALLNTVAHSSE